MADRGRGQRVQAGSWPGKAEPAERGARSEEEFLDAAEPVDGRTVELHAVLEGRLERSALIHLPGGDLEIEWDEAFATLAERLGKIRATDPKKFALFTGRDQMQALTGMFARQFGTPNYAAHGGFCSVNMAAGMIYTIGGSFWEFGGPDLERAREGGQGVLRRRRRGA